MAAIGPAFATFCDFPSPNALELQSQSAAATRHSLCKSL